MSSVWSTRAAIHCIATIGANVKLVFLCIDLLLLAARFYREIYQISRFHGAGVLHCRRGPKYKGICSAKSIDTYINPNLFKFNITVFHRSKINTPLIALWVGLDPET